MKGQVITLQSALSLPPGPTLDKFVFEEILGGLVDPSMPQMSLPSFSKKFVDAHPLLIKIMMENQEHDLTVSLGEQYFNSAKKARFVDAVTDPCPVWKVFINGCAAYGKSFQIAICKLAIVLEIKNATAK
jgi:hypothetical protein